MKTGWPTPHLMQDDCRKLSVWFATRLDARYVFLKTLGDPHDIQSSTADITYIRRGDSFPRPHAGHT